MEALIESFESDMASGALKEPDPYMLIADKLAPEAGKKENQKRKGKDRHTERSNIPIMQIQEPNVIQGKCIV